MKALQIVMTAPSNALTVIEMTDIVAVYSYHYYSPDGKTHSRAGTLRVYDRYTNDGLASMNCNSLKDAKEKLLTFKNKYTA